MAYLSRALITAMCLQGPVPGVCVYDSQLHPHGDRDQGRVAGGYRAPLLRVGEFPGRRGAPRPGAVVLQKEIEGQKEAVERDEKRKKEGTKSRQPAGNPCIHLLYFDYIAFLIAFVVLIIICLGPSKEETGAAATIGSC